MRRNPQALHHLVRYALTELIAATLEARFHPQPCAGFRSFDVLDHRLERPQRYTRPVQADVTEQPVLDRVPFRAAGRIVADGDGQAGEVAQLLQLRFPYA